MNLINRLRWNVFLLLYGILRRRILRRGNIVWAENDELFLESRAISWQGLHYVGRGLWRLMMIIMCLPTIPFFPPLFLTACSWMEDWKRDWDILEARHERFQRRLNEPGWRIKVVKLVVTGGFRAETAYVGEDRPHYNGVGHGVTPEEAMDDALKSATNLGPSRVAEWYSRPRNIGEATGLAKIK